jgi:hypothetical protein
MHQLATTFEECIQILAIESPHALILDWWGRLELAINEYFEVYGIAIRSSVPSKEQAMGNDPRLGPEITAHLRELRLIRNKVAHEKRKPISVDDATKYAQKADELIWIIARAQSS